MAISLEFAGFVLDQLSPLRGVSLKKMFGGACVFYQGKAFGLIDSDDTFYLKVDDTNRADFEAAGSRWHRRLPGRNPRKIRSGIWQCATRKEFARRISFYELWALRTPRFGIEGDKNVSSRFSIVDVTDLRTYER
jgi:TfoX/Sxy family transcriptional regulator of competence genes